MKRVLKPDGVLLILEFSKNYPKESTFKYSEKEILLNLENFYNNVKRITLVP